MVLFGITLYKALLIFPSNQRVTRIFQQYLVAYVTLLIFLPYCFIKIKSYIFAPSKSKIKKQK